ncbi:MAG: alpha amylase C-terminal domain-containing protein, partial [Thiohalomonadales bacterium]
LIVCNFTPVPRLKYRIGVLQTGCYDEILNSDATVYGGSNLGNYGGVSSESISFMRHPDSIEIDLPPLGVLVFKLRN